MRNKDVIAGRLLNIAAIYNHILVALRLDVAPVLADLHNQDSQHHEISIPTDVLGRDGMDG
jgi:hypothetical protein